MSEEGGVPEGWEMNPDVVPPSSSRFAPVAARIPLEPSGKMLQSRESARVTWEKIQASLTRRSDG